MSEIEKVQASISHSQEKLPVTEVESICGAIGDIASTLIELAPDTPEIMAAAAHLAEGQEHAANAATAIVTGYDHLNTYLAAIMGTSPLSDSSTRQRNTPAQQSTPVPEIGQGGNAAENQLLSVVDSQYAQLRANEQVEGRPEDLLTVGAIEQGTPEYDHLLASGVSAEALAAGHITRGELLNAGYLFLNRIGNGEKRIISGDMPMPGSTGQTVNFGDRIFLTREELQTAYEYQQQRPEEYGLQGIPLDEIRRDMLLVMYSAAMKPAFEYESDFARSCFIYTPHDDYFSFTADRCDYTEEEWNTVASYWDALAKQYRKDHPEQNCDKYSSVVRAQQEFAAKHCADLYTPKADGDYFGTRTVRGVTMQSFGRRDAKLHGQPSPFLESGFGFTSNLDACVYFGTADIRADNQRRINTATLHLLGGHQDFPGLCETGGQGDQVYMTPGTYARNLYPQTEDAIKERKIEAARLAMPNRQEIRAEAQRRALEAAKEYAAQKPKRFQWVRSRN